MNEIMLFTGLFEPSGERYKGILVMRPSLEIC